MKRRDCSVGKASVGGEGAFSQLLSKIAHKMTTKKRVKKEKKKNGHAILEDEDVILIRVLYEHYGLKARHIKAVFPHISNIKAIVDYQNYSKLITPKLGKAKLILGDKLTKALGVANKA